MLFIWRMPVLNQNLAWAATNDSVVYNNTGKDINRLCIGIVFYSSDDKIIGTVEYYVTDIKNNGSQTVKYDSVYDLSNAYRYTLTYDIVE